MNHNKQSLYSWLGFIFLLLVEFAIFRNYINREIIPFYPKSYDQTVYLLESYKLHENMLFKGRILKYVTQFPLLPQSLLFHVQAALFFLFFGASRFSALMINFIYFALLQTVSFGLFKSISGKYRYGFIFCGILLTTNSIILSNDFRIDFIAACLYGITCAAIIKSHILLSRRWTWISLGSSVLLIMMRYVSVCYVIGLMGLLFLYHLCCYFFLYYLPKGSDPFDIENKISDTKKRLGNLLLFGLGLLFFIAPILWLNLDIIYHYYIVGHVTGDEKLMRLTVALNIMHVPYTFLFYPKVFFSSHFTPTTLIQLGCILMLYCFVILYLKYQRHIKAIGKLSFNIKDNIIFLLLAVFVPTFVLSMDMSKSFLVINIILAPFIYLLLFIYIFFSEKLFILIPRLANQLLTMVTIFFLSVGIYSYCMHLGKERNHHYRDDKDFQVTKMVDAIGDYAGNLHWQTINASSDYLDDYINAPIGPFYYERHGELFDVTTLPLGNNGMTRITKETAFTSLANADIFTTNLTKYTPDKIFPFEQSIAPFRGELQRYARQHMVELGDYFISNYWLRVYARPDLLLRGLVAGKIPSAGIWLVIPSAVANQVSAITLYGAAKGTGPITVSASTTNAQYLSTQLSIKNNQYQVRFVLPTWQHTEPLIIHLLFKTDNVALQAPIKKQFEMKTPIQS